MRCGRQPAVFVLKGKSLTLDGIDLIVDVRELSPFANRSVRVHGRQFDAQQLLDHDPQPIAAEHTAET